MAGEMAGDFRRALMAGFLRDTTSEQKVEVNRQGELLVGQGLPPYTELARQGKGFSVIQTTATAGLVVRPSTVAAITVWNGEQAGGKAYIIDRLFTHNLVGIAAEIRFTLYACIHPAGMTKPTADIAASATNLVGNSGKLYNGLAVVDVGATVVDNGWFPWGSVVDGAGTATVPGPGLAVEVKGRLIVPPQGAISVAIVSSTNVLTFTSGVAWFEEVLTLL
jgi:hypothetical protein